MLYDVILTKSSNGFIARAKDWPEVMAEEDSREGVIQKIQKRFIDYFTNPVEIIQVEVPLSDTQPNPWLDKFGENRNEPN